MYQLSIDIILSYIILSSSILLRRSQPDKWFLVFGLLHSIGQQLIQDFVRSHLASWESEGWDRNGPDGMGSM